jgi:hypothetical protein
MALRVFMSDMAIMLLIPKDPTSEKLKGPPTWERMGKISWKSQRLSLLERPNNWHHFQPSPSRWTVPLREGRRRVGKGNETIRWAMIRKGKGANWLPGRGLSGSQDDICRNTQRAVVIYRCDARCIVTIGTYKPLFLVIASFGCLANHWLSTSPFLARWCALWQVVTSLSRVVRFSSEPDF